ncbi:hypothetical protein [Desulfosarcina sp.]|uniref:hypothetical protein n=1 Tax=Desulfosarcina sp. TaxID=2027861 RepID=UPI003563FA5D
MTESNAPQPAKFRTGRVIDSLTGGASCHYFSTAADHSNPVLPTAAVARQCQGHRFSNKTTGI